MIIMLKYFSCLKNNSAVSDTQGSYKIHHESRMFLKLIEMCTLKKKIFDEVVSISNL